MRRSRQGVGGGLRAGYSASRSGVGERACAGVPGPEAAGRGALGFRNDIRVLGPGHPLRIKDLAARRSDQRETLDRKDGGARCQGPNQPDR